MRISETLFKSEIKCHPSLIIFLKHKFLCIFYLSIINVIEKQNVYKSLVINFLCCKKKGNSIGKILLSQKTDIFLYEARSKRIFEKSLNCIIH